PCGRTNRREHRAGDHGPAPGNGSWQRASSLQPGTSAVCYFVKNLGPQSESPVAGGNALSGDAGLSREPLLAELKAKLSDHAVLRSNEHLAKRTTLRVGGAADFYAEPASEADLSSILHWCAQHQVPF